MHGIWRLLEFSRRKGKKTRQDKTGREGKGREGKGFPPYVVNLYIFLFCLSVSLFFLRLPPPRNCIRTDGHGQGMHACSILMVNFRVWFGLVGSGLAWVDSSIHPSSSSFMCIEERRRRRRARFITVHYITLQYVVHSLGEERRYYN